MSASSGRAYVWRRADEAVGHSFARVTETDDGGRFDGTEILVERGRPMRTDFTVLLDGAWQTTAVEASVLTTAERRLDLAADPDRRWLVNGRHAPRLDGCIDVDVAATPLTNTFPIRRYASLAIGEERTAPVAWVEVPSLRVLRVDQTYRRLAGDAWTYADPIHGAFRLTVDGAGIVLDYEGLATRVAPR